MVFAVIALTAFMGMGLSVNPKLQANPMLTYVNSNIIKCFKNTHFLS